MEVLRRIGGEARLAQQLPYISMTLDAHIEEVNEGDRDEESACLSSRSSSSTSSTSAGTTTTSRRCDMRVYWEVSVDMVLYDPEFDDAAHFMSDPSSTSTSTSTNTTISDGPTTTTSSTTATIIRPKEHLLNNLHAADATRINVADVIDMVKAITSTSIGTSSGNTGSDSTYPIDLRRAVHDSR